MKQHSDSKSKPIPYADIFMEFIKAGFVYKDSYKKFKPNRYHLEYPLRGMIYPKNFKNLSEVQAAINTYKKSRQKLLKITNPIK